MVHNKMVILYAGNPFTFNFIIRFLCSIILLRSALQWVVICCSQLIKKWKKENSKIFWQFWNCNCCTIYANQYFWVISVLRIIATHQKITVIIEIMTTYYLKLFRLKKRLLASEKWKILLPIPIAFPQKYSKVFSYFWFFNKFYHAMDDSAPVL